MLAEYRQTNRTYVAHINRPLMAKTTVDYRVITLEQLVTKREGIRG